MFRSSLPALLIALLLCCPAEATEPLNLQITLRNHLFDPPVLKAAAGVPIVLTVTNEDDTPEEFESNVLKLEKIVAGKSSIKLRIKGLAPSSYEFIGDYNASAKGILIVE